VHTATPLRSAHPPHPAPHLRQQAAELEALGRQPELGPSSGGLSSLPTLEPGRAAEDVAGALEARRALLVQRESALQGWSVQLQLQAARLASQAQALQQEQGDSRRAIEVRAGPGRAGLGGGGRGRQRGGPWGGEDMRRSC
jgi:hypothetical protein